MTKAVIFDYEGVFLDQTRFFETRSKRVAHILKQPWTKEFMDYWKNAYIHLTEGKMTLGEYYEKLAKMADAKLNGGEDNEFSKGEELRNKHLPEEIAELKRKLGPEVKFAILGNYVERWADAILVRYNLNKYFKAIVFSEKIKARKPEAEAFQAVADKLGMRPGDCIYIGHSIHDLQAAKKLGMKALFLGEIDDIGQEFHTIVSISEVAKYL